MLNAGKAILPFLVRTELDGSVHSFVHCFSTNGKAILGVLPLSSEPTEIVPLLTCCMLVDTAHAMAAEVQTTEEMSQSAAEFA